MRFGKVASFARAVGVQTQTVYKWLNNGRIDPERLGKVAAALGIKEEELMALEPTILVSLDVVTYANLRVAADADGASVEQFAREFLTRHFGEKK